LAITKRVLESLGIEYVIYVNNRKLLNEVLEKNNIEKKNFEPVIREIDKLDKLSRSEVKKNLKKYNADNILDVFDNFDSGTYENYKEVEEMIKLCEIYGIKVEFSPTLARGLSYYSGNVFEVKSRQMKETITAGGSFIFNDVKCSGISFGLDRLSVLADIEERNDIIMILSVGEPKKSIEIVEELRGKGKKCVLYIDKMRKGLEYANAKGIKKVVFVGKDEISDKKVKIKDLDSGKEEFVDFDKIAKYI
jgi:histidyl-tRNA synthetase